MNKHNKINTIFKSSYFRISAYAFFCISGNFTFGYFWGAIVAFIIIFFISFKIDLISEQLKSNCIGLHIIAILTALGVCLWNQKKLYTYLSGLPELQRLKATLPVSINIPKTISIFGSVLAIYFVYICTLIFWEQIIKIIIDNKMFDNICAAEWILYSSLIIVSLILMIVSFFQTDAFYGTQYKFDIIYTSDSPILIKNNVYLNLTHQENDIRQPLFAVFSIPFVSIPYFVGEIFNVSATVQAILVNSIQIVLLFISNFMLSKMMRLNSIKRISFMLLTFFTYTYLLFSLMMEQYIIAYFWLILSMYLISERKSLNKIVLWGAGGTLLTSIVLMIFIPEESPLTNFKKWFIDMMKYGCQFVVAILAFCRFDIFYYLLLNLSELCKYTGGNIKIIDKIYQYSAFICNYFIAPKANINTTTFNHISWQLDTIVNLNLIGIVILILVVISIILNKDKRSSVLAFCWVVYSLVILVGFGWGTKENGLILYELYFGWAFYVLIYQLIEKIEDKFNIKYLTLTLSIVCSVLLALINIPAILELINFSINNFPV